MRNKPLIYICGPYRVPDPVTNTAKAMEAGRFVRDEFRVPVIIPHLSLFEHLQRDGSDQYWLDATMDLMLCCDAVYRINRSFSSGSDAECQRAEAEGIPVFYSLTELAAWIPFWKAATIKV